MSFLRWAGSKKQLLDVLSCCWHAANCAAPQSARYIEGFSGSAALFFYVRPSKAILVDVNKDLQQCLQRVKDSPIGVSHALRKFKSTETEYYKVRAQDRSNLNEDERAAAFIYLNRNCFNGLYRTNRLGQFNVPYGGSRAGDLPTFEQLSQASAQLQAADIVVGDFYENLSPRLRRNDFLYLDPPYAKRNVDLDNQYGPDVFGHKDIERLDRLLSQADRKGAHFLVSYARCDEISTIAEKWNTHIVQVRRTIAANVSKRGFAEEILITNI